MRTEAHLELHRDTRTRPAHTSPCTSCPRQTRGANCRGDKIPAIVYSLRSRPAHRSLCEKTSRATQRTHLFAVGSRSRRLAPAGLLRCLQAPKHLSLLPHHQHLHPVLCPQCFLTLFHDLYAGRNHRHLDHRHGSQTLVDRSGSAAGGLGVCKGNLLKCCYTQSSITIPKIHNAVRSKERLRR